MSPPGLPPWTMLPFPALVLAIAILPLVAPRAWEKHAVQALVVAICAVPLVIERLVGGRPRDLTDALGAYLAFVTTLGALYVTSSSVRISGDIEATPATNAVLVLAGSVLASFVGTTGASMLLIR